MAKRLLGGIALCACLALNAQADTPTTTILGTPPQPAWSQLSSAQKATLAPLVNDWDKMENYRRKKWLGIADRYGKMSPDEQARVQQRMREWVAMTPQQREKVRDSYKEFRQLPPETKQTVKEKWETYSSLPEEEKARIKQQKAIGKVGASESSVAPSVSSPTSLPTSPESVRKAPSQ